MVPIILREDILKYGTYVLISIKINYIKKESSFFIII